MSYTNPVEALNEARLARETMIRKAKAPVWYHAALGLLAAGDVVAYGAPIWMLLAYQPVFWIGAWLLVRAYRKHTGMWISGYRAGRTRPVAIGLGVSLAGALAVALICKERFGLVWPAWVAAIAIFVIATAAGFLWEAAYRVDLREEAGL